MKCKFSKGQLVSAMLGEDEIVGEVITCSEGLTNNLYGIRFPDLRDERGGPATIWRLEADIKIASVGVAIDALNKKSRVVSKHLLEVEAALLLLEDKMTDAKRMGNDPSKFIPKIIRICAHNANCEQARDELLEVADSIDHTICEAA